MKKLLNFTFRSANGDEINLGANSSDKLGLADNTWYESEDNPLNQIGCQIWATVGNSATLTNIIPLSKALTKAGYGARNTLISTVNYGTKYYLLTTEENPPYLYTVGEYPDQYLGLYRADGTFVGPVFTKSSGNVSACFCGEIYEDGTGTGDLVQIVPKKFGIIYSNKYYRWNVIANFKNERIINIDVIDYLKEYLPTEPEGEFITEGVGDFDASSDRIDLPELPNASALATGMIKIYKMTTLGLTSLNNYLWSDLFDLNTFKKMFSDPMQAILNLSISPIDVTVGSRSYIKIGNISTDVSGEICTSQYQKKDFGIIRLNEYWANFADYSPYTKLNIYLPYIGMQPLNVDDVMNGKLHLVGYLDVLTGSIVYNLFSEQKNHAEHGHQSVLYSWAGNCQYQIPLTANNMSSVISSIASSSLTVVGGIATTKASGGLTAPVVAHTVGSVVSNTLNAKQQTQRGGGVGGASGIFGVQFPYLILERPEQRTIADFNSQIGQPTEKSGVLASFNGLVKVKAVHVNYVEGATESEKAEIERLLKEGVII